MPAPAGDKGWIVLMIRCRTTFVAIASSSFLADFLILTLNLATPFQFLNDVFENIVSFLLTRIKRFEILRIFG